MPSAIFFIIIILYVFVKYCIYPKYLDTLRPY